ncbi:WLM domain-containing protein [Panaeolus papilionaceus]|nr:WLM domain-containing protein [Panaeolus papilionaceus]
MIYRRCNTRESNPNPYINFTAALPCDNPKDQERARQLLRALAAQVRPVMRSHGLEINSFEEYEYNTVFAGRNWNNGETIELVLRRPNGSFYPIYWLMSTLCHELAHIKHMNHGPAFQALWTRLRAEVRQLQDKGYYGDGYWSSGTRLSDSTRVGGVGIEEGDFPEYICGGAQTRARPSSGRRKRRATGKRREVAPSLHTGAQTAKKRRAGARVTSKYAFVGEGIKLGDDTGPGIGFGKRANSNKAREERALVTERRLRALQGQGSSNTSDDRDCSEDSGSEEEYAPISETDAERRETLLASEDSKDISNLGNKLGSRDAWKQFEKDFNFGNVKLESGRTTRITTLDVIDISSDEEDTSRPSGQRCDVQAPSGSTGTIAGARSTTNPSTTSNWGVSNSTSGRGRQELGLGSLVKTEVEFRKKEALGLAGRKNAGGRTLCQGGNHKWTCLVCTLENEGQHSSCSACATPRGEAIWTQGDRN